MEGYLAVLMLKPGQLSSQMNRKLFTTEQACREWVAKQRVPPFASGWYIEAYGEDGCQTWSQGIKSQE